MINYQGHGDCVNKRLIVYRQEYCQGVAKQLLRNLCTSFRCNMTAYAGFAEAALDIDYGGSKGSKTTCMMYDKLPS